MFISEFEKEKRETIKAARELCYRQEVIKRLKKAETPNELTRIMQTARNNGGKWYE